MFRKFFSLFDARMSRYSLRRNSEVSVTTPALDRDALDDTFLDRASAGQSRVERTGRTERNLKRVPVRAAAVPRSLELRLIYPVGAQRLAAVR
jgi:hypothetical protein